MKGDKAVLAELNKLLTNELTAINQYFLHARMWKHWGFVKLAKHEYEESIAETGETVPEGLNCDLALERGARPMLQHAIKICESHEDFVSREILVDILDDTEEHIDYLETQLSLIEQIGLQNYLQSQIEPGSGS